MTDQTAQNQGVATNQDQSMPEIGLDLPTNEESNEPEISISFDDIQNTELDLPKNQIETEKTENIENDIERLPNSEESENSVVSETTENFELNETVAVEYVDDTVENDSDLESENNTSDIEIPVDVSENSMEENIEKEEDLISEVPSLGPVDVEEHVVENNVGNDVVEDYVDSDNGVENENNIEEIKSDFGSLNESISEPGFDNSVNIFNEEPVGNSQEDVENAVMDSAIDSQNIEDETDSMDVKNEENSDSLVNDAQEKSDDWLAKEDALLAEKESEDFVANEPIIEPKQEPKMEENLNVLDVISEDKGNEEVVENNLGIGGTMEQINQNFPENSSWESDQEIISQLKSTEEIPVPVQNNLVPSAAEMNLDDLLGGDVSLPSMEVPVVSNNTIPQNVVATPQIETYNIVQNSVAQPVVPVQNNSVPYVSVGVQGFAMPAVIQNVSEKIKDPKRRSIFIGIGVGTLAILIGMFMLKTMYPLEYKQIVDGGISTSGLENQLADLDQEDESDSTGSDLFNNPALDNYHGSASDFDGIEDDDFNAFEDIETEMAPDRKLLDRLEIFVETGRKYTVLGKKNNDSSIVKYSLFLYRKASALLTDVENGKQIDIDELNDQLADLEKYLQKLTGKNSDGEIVPPQTNAPSPEEFFGTTDFGGQEKIESKQEESIGTGDLQDESTAEETSNEDVSGDENSVLQLDGFDG